MGQKLGFGMARRDFIKIKSTLEANFLRTNMQGRSLVFQYLVHVLSYLPIRLVSCLAGMLVYWGLFSVPSLRRKSRLLNIFFVVLISVKLSSTPQLLIEPKFRISPHLPYYYDVIIVPYAIQNLWGLIMYTG
jgi:hypothetical protein